MPASAFYEWKQTAHNKIPYAIRLTDTDLFAFAGLYDVWKDAEGNERKTYTIITTSPNSLVAPIHNRMPVILARKDEDVWLNGELSDPEPLLQLLKPYPADAMEAYAVSTAVNNPKNDDEELLQPIMVSE